MKFILYLLDLLTNANANIISLYAKDPYGKLMKEEVCPLSAWNGNSNIKELYAEDIDEKDLAKLLLT